MTTIRPRRASRSQSPARPPRRRRGFTFLELQVAIILLAFGVVTLASLMATQRRVMHRLGSQVPAGTTVYVTRSQDPWVRKLRAAARITAEPATSSPPPAVVVRNSVSIYSESHDLPAESITVIANVAEAP